MLNFFFFRSGLLKPMHNSDATVKSFNDERENIRIYNPYY